MLPKFPFVMAHERTGAGGGTKALAFRAVGNSSSLFENVGVGAVRYVYVCRMLGRRTGI
jgi:hypothetical protein